MDRLAVKSALTLLWPLLHRAQGGSTRPNELAEIRRLLDLIANATVAVAGYEARADALRLYVISSGLFETTDGKGRGLDRALAMIDDLKEFLARPCH